MFRNASLIKIKGTLTTLKGIVSLLKNPGNTLGIYDIEDGFRYRKSTELSVEFIKSQPEVDRIIQERYLAPSPDVEALIKCPFGSLGYCYAAYFKEFGLETDFYRVLTVDDDTSYIFCAADRLTIFGILLLALVRI
jgi:ubiquinone biosynthesis protein COQ4